MREIRSYGSVRGVRSNPYPYRDMVNPVRSTARFSPSRIPHSNLLKAALADLPEHPPPGSGPRRGSAVHPGLRNGSGTLKAARPRLTPARPAIRNLAAKEKNFRTPEYLPDRFARPGRPGTPTAGTLFSGRIAARSFSRAPGTSH